MESRSKAQKALLFLSKNNIIKIYLLIGEEIMQVLRRKPQMQMNFSSGFIFTIFAPLYFYLVSELMHFGTFGKLFAFLSEYSGAAFFSLFVLYGIYVVLWLIVKKGFVPCIIYAVFLSVFSIINYYKRNLTGDFLYPWDIINQTGNIGSLAGFIKSGLPLKYIALLLIGLVFPAFSYFKNSEFKIKTSKSVVVSLFLVFVMFFSLGNPDRAGKTFKKFNMDIISAADQNTNHLINGFCGGFLVNLLSMNIKKPEGYSEDKTEKLLSTFEETKNPKFSKPDIILVLSESFWDPKLLPQTEFSENPTANFEEIAMRENARSGYMYQTAFGGGTVRTEFEVLTGLSSDYIPAGTVPWQFVHKDIPTYVSHYRDLGYKTVFLHTYLPTFYSREKTYPYLGFDELFFQDELTEIPEIEWRVSGNYISDDSFVSYIEYLLKKESPSFIFGISMENHQPYENKYESPRIKVKNESFSEKTLSAVENFATGVYMEDLALKKLADIVDKRERQTILIYFGDHLPSLGTEKAAYTESGFIGDKMSDEDWKKLMRTPYLIYSNFPLEKTEKKEISSYNLINFAGELIGAPKTPLVSFLSDYYDEIPYYNERLKITPSESQKKFIDYHKDVTYYNLNR